MQPYAPAPVAAVPEQVIYEGPAQVPMNQIAVDILACLVCLGFVLLPWHFYVFRKTTYRITTRQIRIESGIITRRTEVMDLWKIRDVQLETTLGRDTVVIHSTDVSTPLLRIRIPGGRRVFEHLQVAIPAARQGAGVMLHQA